jgi:hypothetical protein
MKLNNVIFVLAIVVISIWMFQLYRSRCINIEFYSGISDGLEKHINDSEKPLLPLYIMNTFNQLTEDDNIVQEAYNSALMNDRNTLYILLQKVKKENKNVKDK